MSAWLNWHASCFKAYYPQATGSGTANALAANNPRLT